MLKEFGKSNNIAVIDMYDSFYKGNKEIPLFLRIDGHYSKEGHRSIAQEVYNYLKRTGVAYEAD